VQSEDRVEVLARGEGVRIRRFGGEGTGGQYMAPCPWKLGGTNRFVVQGEVQGDKTAYTAYLWLPSRQGWWKLATFRTRTGGRLFDQAASARFPRIREWRLKRRMILLPVFLRGHDSCSALLRNDCPD
jgi:hypothetical protein